MSTILFEYACFNVYIHRSLLLDTFVQLLINAKLNLSNLGMQAWSRWHAEV